MLYLAYDEPEADYDRPPVWPKIHGIFESLLDVITFLSKKESPYKYAGCYVMGIDCSLAFFKTFNWFNGRYVNGNKDFYTEDNNRMLNQVDSLIKKTYEKPVCHST